MIKYFGKSFLSRYLILLLLLVLGWLPAIIDPTDFFILPNESLFIGENLGDSVNLYWLVVLPLVMAVSMFGLNLLAVKQGFTGMISMLTMFLYFLYLSAYPACFSANNIILISFLFILILQSIMSFHERDDSIKNAFNSGIFVGLASVFYPPAVYLIIVIWFGILLHRVNSWRPFIASILGVFSNYLLLFSWYFVTDQWKQKGLLYLESVVPAYAWKMEGNMTETAILGLLLVFSTRMRACCLCRIGVLHQPTGLEGDSSNSYGDLLRFCFLFRDNRRKDSVDDEEAAVHCCFERTHPPRR